MFLLFLACAPSLCQDAANPPAGPTIPNLPNVNARLLRLVVQDQWDRGNDMFSGKDVKPPANLNIPARDAERQAEVRQIITEGGVNTGQEYFYAALIFQHSSTPENLMFAHVLAVTAVVKGNADAKWMAAATFDRYLWSIKQPQVFGTQLKPGADDKWTMEPYDRSTISDSIRAGWCVVPLAEQEKALQDRQNGGLSASSKIPGCK